MSNSKGKYGPCVCGYPLREEEGHLTCDNPLCAYWFKDIDVGWRVVGSGPRLYIGKSFWASEHGFVKANHRCCIVNFDYIKAHRHSGMAIGPHQKLRVVRRQRILAG